MTRQERFKQELFALLRKYDVEMQVEEDTSGYSFVATGVNFFGYAKWDEAGNEIVETIDLTIGTRENGKED